MSAIPDLHSASAAVAGALGAEALEEALRAARVGAWEVRLPDFVLAFSDSFYALMGASPEEGRLDPGIWRRRCHPEDLSRVESMFNDHVAGRTPEFEAEYRLGQPDGSWRWVLARAETTQRDLAGNAYRITGVTIDIHARRQAEDSLRESEERFRLAAASANGVVYEADIRAKSTMLHGLQALTGYSTSEGLGSLAGWMQIVHPDDRALLAAQVAENRLGRSQYEMTYRILHKDGRVIYVWHRGIYLRDARGEPIRAIGIIEDVTASVGVRRALARSEFRLQTMADMSPGYIFEVVLRDLPAEPEVFASPSFGRLMGCTYLDFLSSGGLLAFCDAESRPHMLRALDRMNAGLKVDLVVHGFNRRGEELWLRIKSQPVYDTVSGRRTGTIGAAHDITTERRAEIALKAEQEKLQALAGASATQLALFDLDRRCLFANFSLRGRPVAEMLGLRIDELVPPHMAQRARANFDQIVRTGTGIDAVEEFPLEGGQPRSFSIRMRPVWSNGRAIGVVSNITDITEQRRTQEDLNLQAVIIDTMQEGVLLLDRSANIVLTNSAIDVALGFPRGVLVGRNAGEFTMLDQQSFLEFSQRVLAEIDAGDSPQFELEGRRADGSRLVASCIFTGVAIAGEPRVIAVINDITERKRLERQMLQVATREQQRIGGDLHDGLGQQLTGVAMLLKGVTKKIGPLAGRGIRQEVDRVIGLVNAAIESTRSLARGLSPVGADSGGLNVALQELANRTLEFYKVPVALEVLLPSVLSLDENVANQLYRIAQEAVTNAIRHGRARQINLRLQVNDGRAQLVVNDDGDGFDPRRILPTSTGLKIMRFRAQMVGGLLTVDSAPGAGATIRCQCPLGTEVGVVQ